MDTVKAGLKNVKMIAHRGLSGIERENTCPAFVAAGNRSYFGIETDIRRSGDGKIVIMHDETCERVSLKEYDSIIETSTIDELQKIVLPDKDKTFLRQDIRIPLFKEYLKICKKYEKKSIVELKSEFSEKEIESILKEVKEEYSIDEVIFISFSMQNCLKIRKVSKKAKVQFLSIVFDEALFETLIENDFGLDIRYTSVNEEIVKKMHRHALEVNVWTCDSKKEAEELAKMGVDYITTNILE